MQLTFEPHIPLALWTPLALLAAALWVCYALASRQRLRAWRRALALSLMALAIALPLGILLNPTWTKRLPPPAGKPLLTVLIDNSQSMGTTDGASGQSRYAQAAAIADQVERQLGERFDVELKTFGASVKPTAAAELPKVVPEGETTDIAAGLESSLADRPQGQALLLLGDGVHNAGGGAARLRQSAERAKAMSTPIYTTTLGQQTTVRDLEVTLNLAEELAFVDQEIPLLVALRQRGQLAGPVKLSIQLDGKPVETRTVSLAADDQQSEVFTIKQAKAGLYRYDIAAEEIAGEVTSVNNHATLMLRVVDEPVRVALLEGKPYWDTKFLVRTLSADPSVELTSVVRMTPGRFLERRITRPRKDETEPAPAADEDATTAAGSGSETIPVSAPALQSEAWEIKQNVASLLEDGESLQQFQVIILGRDAEAFLTDNALVQLKKWLAQGEGSLVCFRGSPSSQVNQRLGELMPVKWSAGRESRFRVRLTESGEAMGWMPRQNDEQVLTNLPSLATGMKPEGTKPLAVVLATGAGQAPDKVGDPVISFQPIGNGRVVVLEGAGMWRWAFLPAEFQQHDEVYGRLWRSLTRWLISNIGLLPSQQQALRSDKITFGSSDIATGTLLTRLNEGETTTAKPPQVELTSEGIGRTQLFTPVQSDEVAGQFRVVFGKLPEGRYQARIVGANDKDAGTRAAFDVRGNFTERLDVAARMDVMKLIAQRSGGAVLAADEVTALAEKFAKHQAANMPERTLRTTAWDRWWVLLLVIASWGVAWGVRRRAGLV